MRSLKQVVVVVAMGLLGVLVASSALPSTAATKPKSKPLVVIQAYYPINENHQYIVDYLKKFGKAHPGKVSVEIIDNQTPAGRKRWAKTGLSCAGVLINGKTKWQLKRGAKTETVDFIKRMDVMWTRADFEAVVSQLLNEAK